MELTLVDTEELRYVEGLPDTAFLRNIGDIDRLIETCFADNAKAALLYSANLTPAFFDLSSGDAGAILQKLRTYRIRLAVVCPPRSVVFSQRFNELMIDEQRGTDFGVFETRQVACDWLRHH